MELHPERAGMCVLWEPDAFDGNDAQFVDAPEHDATGRFMSYWARVGGELVSEPLRDYEDPKLGAWYVTPRTLKKPVIIEPYPYEVGGKTLMLTTIAIPIMDGDKVLGVVTSDFELSALQERIAQLRPMGQGRTELLSPMGMVVASPDAANVGKTRDDDTTRAILAAVAEDKLYSNFQADGNGMVQVYAPLRIGKSDRRFALGVMVPRDLLTAQARSLLELVALVGLLAAASLCAGLWLLLRAMVLEYPDDLSCRYLDTQYMLGSALLVGLIFNPQGEATFYLPEGEWRHLISGEKRCGPGWHKATYDYFSLPLWVNVERGAEWDCLNQEFKR